MEELVLFRISTPWKPSLKLEVGEDNLVDYFGERMSIEDTLERYRKDNPNDNIIRADVCKRLDIPSEKSKTSYTWVELRRLV